MQLLLVAIWAIFKTKVTDNYSNLEEPIPVRLLEAPAKSPTKEDEAQGLVWGGWREEEAAVLAGSACALCAGSSSAVGATTTRTGLTACGSGPPRPVDGKSQTAAVRR